MGSWGLRPRPISTHRSERLTRALTGVWCLASGVRTKSTSHFCFHVAISLLTRERRWSCWVKLLGLWRWPSAERRRPFYGGGLGALPPYRGAARLPLRQGCDSDSDHRALGSVGLVPPQHWPAIGWLDEVFQGFEFGRASLLRGPSIFVRAENPGSSSTRR
jgi:hypothetical protein